MLKYLVSLLLMIVAGPPIGIASGQTMPALPPVTPAANEYVLQIGNETANDCDPAATARAEMLQKLVDIQKTYIKALEKRVRQLEKPH